MGTLSSLPLRFLLSENLRIHDVFCVVVLRREDDEANVMMMMMMMMMMTTTRRSTFGNTPSKKKEKTFKREGRRRRHIKTTRFSASPQNPHLHRHLKSYHLFYS